mgnify:CR=1 FL=1
MGLIAQSQGDHGDACTLLGDGLAVSRAAGDRSTIAECLTDLGRLALGRGDDAAARAWLDEALGTSRQAGERRGVGGALEVLGQVAQRTGDVTEARRCWHDSLAMYEDLGDRLGIAAVQNFLGRLAYLAGDYTESTTAYRTSVSLTRSVGRMDWFGVSFDGIAGPAVAAGQFARALRLAGASAAHRERFPNVTVPYGLDEVARAVASAREALGPPAADACWEAGRAMTLEQAIAYALRDDADDWAARAQDR